VLFSLSALAQSNTGSNGKITGKVTDAVTKIPVDFATVSIYKQGNASPFNGASTDPKGNFKIDNIPAGDYKVTVDFLGYTRTTIDHVIISNTVKIASLGNILLAPVQNQLKGVVITAQAPTVENKIDKLVYNPANDLSAQGGTASDILKKVPMVSVDVDGNVELMGNSNIRFLINGKPSSIFGASLADALQSIPANQIKNIEVITSPGAKYDAEGTGGIINIVLKDSKIQGINGSVNLSGGTRFENGSFNLNARKGNFGVNAFFSGNEQLNTTTLNTTNRTSYSNTRDTVTQLSQKGSNAFKRSGYQSGISFNWDASKKDQLTASFNFNHFDNNSVGITNQNQSTLSTLTNLTVDTASVNNSLSHFSANSMDWSLSYKKTFTRKDQELDVLYHSSFGSNTNNYSQEQDYTGIVFPASGSIGSNPGTDKETDVSVDYTQPVTDNFTIETGAKTTIENLGNTVVTQALTNGVYVPNPFQTYSFNYKRSIYAYYLSTNFSLFHNFLDAKAGLRYEYTSSTSDFPNTIIPSYGIFAPSGVISHKLDKTQTIKLSYTYRLQRPDYRSLNPFYNISDPHNISTGDPELKPELGHNFELGYNKSFDKGSSIYISAFYRYNTNDLQSFTTFYPNLKIGDTTYSNVALTQQYNLGKEVTEGINLYGSVPLTKDLSVRSNMFFADRTSYNPGFADVSGFTYRINLNASYDFGHDFLGEFFINYRSSQKTIQGTNPAFTFYNLAFRKQFMNKKMSLGITAANPFNHYVDVDAITYGSNFYQTSLRQIPLQSFGITWSYKFGKLEFKKEKEQPENTPPVPEEGGNGK
jgi:outer membrane receptor protein involved in Fe transport